MVTKTIEPKVHTTITYYFTCPNCDSEERHDISHLINDHANFDRKMETRTCRACQHKIHFTLRAKHDASGVHVSIETEVTPIALKDQLTSGLVLLESNCEDENGRIYLVVHSDYLSKLRTPEEEGTLFYHYDEGTCPTNWSKDIVAFIHQGDSDPHGVFTYVRHLTWSEINKRYREHGLEPKELDKWIFVNNNYTQMLFPELFKNPQPPKSW